MAQRGHFGALLEQSLDDDARDACANIRNPRGRDPAWKFPNKGARLRPYGEGADFRFGRSCRYRGHSRRLIAASQ